MHNTDYASLVRATIETTPVSRRLQHTRAVVLERIARGAGATNWYCCADADNLGALETRLSPGSAVTFYFDARIRESEYSPMVKSAVQRIIGETGDAVLGILREDGLCLDVTLVTGPNDLTEFEQGLKCLTRVFYGAFPARDDDGVNAVTVVLPDADGVVRSHPH